MTATLHYTQSILKQAIGNYIQRVYLKRMLWLSIGAIGLVIYSFSFVDSPWLQACAVVPVVAIPVMLVLGYWFRLGHSLKALNLLENGKVKMTLNDSSITIESAIGKSETNWKIYTELWEFPTNYLLFYTNFQFLTLPKDQVSTEFIDFIKRHLKPT
jgi:hypothetical protein